MEMLTSEVREEGVAEAHRRQGETECGKSKNLSSVHGQCAERSWRKRAWKAVQGDQGKSGKGTVWERRWQQIGGGQVKVRGLH